MDEAFSQVGMMLVGMFGMFGMGFGFCLILALLAHWADKLKKPLPPYRLRSGEII